MSTTPSKSDFNVVLNRISLGEDDFGTFLAQMPSIKQESASVLKMNVLRSIYVDSLYCVLYQRAGYAAFSETRGESRQKVDLVISPIFSPS